jgi:hypothetical protein
MGKKFQRGLFNDTGYDNAKKVFMSSWIDNRGTGIMNLEGNWDSVTNTLVLRGNTTDPLTGKDIPIREVLKFNDDNHQQLEMYFTENGKEFKGMEIKSTRK